MTDYVTLLGAEQVQSAANTISNAADTMRRAVTELEFALIRHQTFMDDWLQRLEAVMEKSRTTG